MQLVTQSLVDQVLALTLCASKAIMSIYHNDKANFSVDIKEDNSPVTNADRVAHQILVAGLRELLPNTPILSEESAIPTFAQRRHWSRYWLIDSLDGTKEFIHRNGEFTVNVALIEHGEPVFGVVTIPVSNISYWGAKGLGAYKVSNGQASVIAVRAMPLLNTTLPDTPLTLLTSRRHGGEAMMRFMAMLNKQFAQISIRHIGSALKFCLLAEGLADIYPRLAPTSEWDTAAAQAIVEAAGGCVVDVHFCPLRYNTKPSLLNPFFYVLADKEYPWKAQLLTPVEPTIN
jgi:3'(2'), 5'-bisphosphate nucleotidase